MRYPPEQVERLAGEYVLGTLHGAARRRMQALMRDRADVRIAVWEWERALHGLTGVLEPVAPPASVWRGIEQHIGQTPGVRTQKRGWWPKMAFASLAVAVLAFWLGTVLPPTDQTQQLAIFADEAAVPLWVIEADGDSNRLIAETSGVAPAGDDRVYELWALPAGEAPRSLGILDIAAGRYERALEPELLAAIDNSASLAISLEPPGGSPTGLPTGPIVYQAALVRL